MRIFWLILNGPRVVLATKRPDVKNTRGDVSEIYFDVPYIAMQGEQCQQMRLNMTVDAALLMLAAKRKNIDKKINEPEK